MYLERNLVNAKAFSKHLQIVCVVSLVTAVLTLINVHTISGQQGESNEIVITVEPVIPIATDTTPDQYRFECSYLLSNCYINEEDKYIGLHILEGIIGWNFGGYSINNATIFDNLGNSFDPLVKGNRVCNPKADVVLPPRFEYKIFLSFMTGHGVSFDNENKEYLLELNFEIASPNTLKVKFPINFTVLQCNVHTLYAVNVHRTQDNSFVTLRCDVLANKPFSMFVRFLPFCVQGTVRSFRFTLDIPEVFPIRGYVKGTYEEVFETPATFSIWEINPLFAIPITFPEYAYNLTVEKVWDGLGDCKAISKPVENLTNSSLGYYYVDNENRQVTVYPRYHYRGDFYEYSLGVTFICPPEYKPFKMEAYNERGPYTYESRFMIDEVLTPPNWKLDITGNVEVRFILPTGAEPLVSESGNPTIGLEGDRPVALFVYNSPKTLSPSGWRVVYDIVSLRSFFWLEVVSLISLLLISVVIVVFNLPSGVIIAFLTSALGIILPTNVISFLGLGGSKPFFIVLFVVEVVLFSVIVTASARKLGKKRFSLKVLIRWLHLRVRSNSNSKD